MPEKGPKDILASETQQQGTLARTDQTLVCSCQGSLNVFQIARGKWNQIGSWHNPETGPRMESAG